MPTQRTLALFLATVGGLVCGSGLAVELMRYAGHLDPDAWLRWILSLSYEANVPTWYSAGLLWTAGLGLAGCAAQSERHERPHWWVLAGMFMLMSLDEAIELHEYLGKADTHGVLYYSWIIPGAAITLVVGLVFLRFWLNLRPPTRRGFGWAAALYIGGAIGIELPLGAWFEAHGDENLGYALIDLTEESLEISGISVFLVAILGHLSLGQTSEPGKPPDEV